MQTPKEKAKELIDRFKPFVPHILDGFEDIDFIKMNAKACAQVCTEEIIIELYDNGIREPQFWYEVQRELDAL